MPLSPPEPPPPRAELAYEWNPERAAVGPMVIEIYPDDGKLVVNRNGVCIGYSMISAGRDGFFTPSGSYSILEKKADYRSNRYGTFVDSNTGVVVKRDARSDQKPPPGSKFLGAEMPYFQRLTYDGIGLHAGYLPGYNASHGCIRLPVRFAEMLFSATKMGTPVRVIRAAANPVVPDVSPSIKP